MNYKEALQEIEKLENGADILSAIKSETARLNGEAKENRVKGDQLSKKLTEVLSAVGIADDENTVESVRLLRSTLDSFQQGGKKPEEVAKQITELTKKVNESVKALETMTKTAEAEKTKRIAALKHSKAVDLLTKGNAAAPEKMADLLDSYITIGEDESMSFKDGEQEMSLEDGVKTWLSNNPWAVKVNGSGGGGAPAGGSGGADPFLTGLKS